MKLKRNKREGSWTYIASPPHECAPPALRIWCDPAWGHGSGGYVDNLDGIEEGSIWTCNTCHADWRVVEDAKKEFKKTFEKCERFPQP